MTNDDNMDTTNPLMDKEQFVKEDLLSIDEDNEDIDKVNSYILYYYNVHY